MRRHHNRYVIGRGVALTPEQLEDARSAVYDTLEENLGTFVANRLDDEVIDEVIAAAILPLFDDKLRSA